MVPASGSLTSTSNADPGVSSTISMMFYAVQGGPTPGVYSSWEEAKRYSGPQSLCKKFRDQSEAEVFAIR